MGYTTNFEGSISIDPPLKPEHLAYLAKFSDIRHMKRNEETLAKMADPLREAVGLPVGQSGEYFVGASGFAGQDEDGSILNHNGEPSTQPGLWCQWAPNEQGTAFEWDGGEKFYEYTAWMEYLVAHFYTPWGYTLNGEITWEGEDDDDVGAILVKNNKVLTFEGDNYQHYLAEAKAKNEYEQLDETVAQLLDKVKTGPRM